MEQERDSPPPARVRRAMSQAKRLRKRATPPERILWRQLRNRQLGGLKFRRQHPLGPYIADFYCDEQKLLVEVDGEVHGKQREADTARTEWLRAHGLRVFRVTASDIACDLDAVLLGILRKVGRS